MFARYLQAIGLIAFLTSGSAFAGPGPIPGTQRIAPAFQVSDLVCNCVVESIKVVREERLGTPPKTLMRQNALASVLIDDEYKPGTNIGGRRITIQFEREIPSMRASLPSVQEGERALMFLKKQEGVSVYVFADPFLGATPFDLLQKTSEDSGLMKLQTALANTVQQGNREDQIRAMRVLEGFDELSPKTLSAVKLLSYSVDPEVVFSAIAMLLKARVVGTVLLLDAYLRAHELARIPIAMLSVGDELGQGCGDQDLSGLEALTSSRILSIKLGAIAGVRKMRNPHSAKALVGLLDDANPDVRFLAVITLSEIFAKGDDYAPDMSSFGRNPEFYVGLWKSWWATEGQAYRPGSAN